MKMTEQYKKAQENMKVGVIAAEGYLGQDHRPLVDIIEADEETMKNLGLDWDDVVSQLKLLMEEGSKGLGEPITVKNTWRVRVDETRGTLPSPWEDGIFHKVNVEVHRLDESGKELTPGLIYNELCLHMIEKYHFLQGKGSSFRLDPRDIQKILF